MLAELHAQLLDANQRLLRSVLVVGLDHDSEQFRTSWPDGQIHGVQSDCQHDVEQEDDHERPNEGGRGRAADAFRAGIAMKAVVTTDQGNGAREEQALENAAEKVETADGLLRVSQVIMRIDAQLVNTPEFSAEDPREVGYDRQGGDQQQAARNRGTTR